MSPEYLSVAEVAAILGASKDVIYADLQAGLISLVPTRASGALTENLRFCGP